MLPHGQGVYDLSSDELERLIDEVMVERGFEDFVSALSPCRVRFTDVVSVIQ
jgi:hypothetical protein